MSSRRKTNRQFTAIGDVLSEVLKGYERRSRGGLPHVQRVWKACVGPAIAANTRPVALRGGRLVVVASSTWLHQLQFLKPDIIGGLNRHTGDVVVEDIRFRIGTL